MSPDWSIPRRGQQRRERPLCRSAAALAAVLLLGACQSVEPPDERAAGQTTETLLRVADETRARGDSGTAITLYRRLHERSPKDPKPLTHLGFALMDVKDYTAAAEAFRAALARAPDDADTHRGLATVLLSLNQPAPAMIELAKAASLSQQPDPRILNAMGVAQDLLGRHDLAKEDYLSALRIDPNNAAVRNNYGLSLALAGDYSSAATTLAPVADDPSAPARYKLNLALIYGLAGDDAKAAQIASTELDEAAVRNNLAYYAVLRRLDDKGRTAAIIAGQMHGPSVSPDSDKHAGGQQPAAAAKQAGAATETSPQPSPAPTAVANGAGANPTAQAATAAPDAASAAAPAAQNATTPAAEPAKPAAEAEASGPPIKLTPGGAPQSDSAATTPSPAASAAQPGAGEAPAPNGNAAAQTSAPAAASPDQSGAAPAAASSDQNGAAATAGAPASANTASAASPTPPAASATAPSAAAKPASPTASDYVVQFGAFSVAANAQRLADQLNGKGYRASVVAYRDHKGRQMYAVRGEAYDNVAAADAAAKRIHEIEGVPTAVIHAAAAGATSG